MASFLTIFQHLLPKAEAWRLTVTKPLRKFFEGLAGFFQYPRDFIDGVLLDLYPSTTGELARWERQFGLAGIGTEDERRLILDAAWKRTGGSTKAYIESQLAAYGFEGVHVHEWWESGPPYVARDPHLYTNPPSSGLDPHYFASKRLTGTQPDIPNDPTKYPFFLYVGGETFPSSAEVLAERRAEFEALMLRLRPAQHWVVFAANYVSSLGLVTPAGGITGHAVGVAAVGV